MNIEIEYKEPKQIEFQYPCVLQHIGTNELVLFTKKRYGVIIKSGSENSNGFCLGIMCTGWNMTDFTYPEHEIKSVTFNL